MQSGLLTWWTSGNRRVACSYWRSTTRSRWTSRQCAQVGTNTNSGTCSYSDKYCANTTLFDSLLPSCHLTICVRQRTLRSFGSFGSSTSNRSLTKCASRAITVRRCASNSIVSVCVCTIHQVWKATGTCQYRIATFSWPTLVVVRCVVAQCGSESVVLALLSLLPFSFSHLNSINALIKSIKKRRRKVRFGLQITSIGSFCAEQRASTSQAPMASWCQCQLDLAKASTCLCFPTRSRRANSDCSWLRATRASSRPLTKCQSPKSTQKKKQTKWENKSEWELEPKRTYLETGGLLFVGRVVRLESTFDLHFG